MKKYKIQNQSHKISHACVPLTPNRFLDDDEFSQMLKIRISFFTGFTYNWKGGGGELDQSLAIVADKKKRHSYWVFLH